MGRASGCDLCMRSLYKRYKAKMNDKATPKVVETQEIPCPEDGPLEITAFDAIAGFVIVFLFVYIVSEVVRWRRKDETS